MVVWKEQKVSTWVPDHCADAYLFFFFLASETISEMNNPAYPDNILINNK